MHRIGRTARADRDGEAITLVRGYEIADFMEIEKFLEKVVEKIPLPEGLGEAPEYKPMRRNGNRQRGRGGRRGHGGGRGGHGRRDNRNGEKNSAENSNKSNGNSKGGHRRRSHKRPSKPSEQ